MKKIALAGMVSALALGCSVNVYAQTGKVTSDGDIIVTATH